jgi:hypothetical protein
MGTAFGCQIAVVVGHWFGGDIRKVGYVENFVKFRVGWTRAATVKCPMKGTGEPPAATTTTQR